MGWKIAQKKKKKDKKVDKTAMYIYNCPNSSLIEVNRDQSKGHCPASDKVLLAFQGKQGVGHRPGREACGPERAVA
jgi:hypothetical protein